ncbi:50S ribosomal protein L9 [Gammaproteobacteria bacterium]|nr:50S ribosomal protein L9 [Gammaproteobacteria bacterium]
MKVILVESVIGLGRAGEVVSVKAGYGRNYLIPRGIAVFSSPENMILVEAKKAEMEKVDAKRRKEAEKVAEELKALTLVIKVETNDDGQMFGTIGPSEIVNHLSTLGVNIERKMVSVPKVISEIGEHQFLVQCHIDVQVELKLEVTS